MDAQIQRRIAELRRLPSSRKIEGHTSPFRMNKAKSHYLQILSAVKEDNKNVTGKPENFAKVLQKQSLVSPTPPNTKSLWSSRGERNNSPNERVIPKGSNSFIKVRKINGPQLENTVRPDPRLTSTRNRKRSASPVANYKSILFHLSSLNSGAKEDTCCVYDRATEKEFLVTPPDKRRCSNEFNTKVQFHNSNNINEAHPVKLTAVKFELDRRENNGHENRQPRDTSGSSEFHEILKSNISQWYYDDTPSAQNIYSGKINTDSKMYDTVVYNDRAVAKDFFNIAPENQKCNDELNAKYRKNSIKIEAESVKPTAVQCSLNTRGETDHAIKQSKDSKATSEIPQNCKNNVSQCNDDTPSAQNMHTGEVNKGPKVYFIPRYINDTATMKEFLNIAHEERQYNHELNMKYQLHDNSIKKEVESVKLTTVKPELNTQRNTGCENERSRDSNRSEIHQDLKNTVVSQQCYEDNCNKEPDTKNLIYNKNSIKTEAEPGKLTTVQSILDTRGNTVHEIKQTNDSVKSEIHQNSQNSLSQWWCKDTPFPQNTYAGKINTDSKVNNLSDSINNRAIVKGVLNIAPKKCSDKLNRKNRIYDQKIKTEAEPVKSITAQSKLDEKENTVHEMERSKDSSDSSEIHPNPENNISQWYKDMQVAQNACKVGTNTKEYNIPVCIHDREVAKDFLIIPPKKRKCSNGFNARNQIHNNNIRRIFVPFKLTAVKSKLDTRGYSGHENERKTDSSTEIHQNLKSTLVSHWTTAQRCYDTPSTQETYTGKVDTKPNLYNIHDYVTDRAAEKEFLNVPDEKHKSSDEFNTKNQSQKINIKTEARVLKLTAVLGKIRGKRTISHENELIRDSNSGSEIHENLKSAVISERCHKDAPSAQKIYIGKVDTEPIPGCINDRVDTKKFLNTRHGKRKWSDEPNRKNQIHNNNIKTDSVKLAAVQHKVDIKRNTGHRNKRSKDSNGISEIHQNLKTAALSQPCNKDAPPSQKTYSGKVDAEQKVCDTLDCANDRGAGKEFLNSPPEKLKCNDELNTKKQSHNFKINRTVKFTVGHVKIDKRGNVDHEKKRPRGSSGSSEIHQNLKNTVVSQWCYKDVPSAQNAYSRKADKEQKVCSTPDYINDRIVMKEFLNIAPENRKCSDERNTKNQIQSNITRTKVIPKPRKLTAMKNESGKDINSHENERSRDSSDGSESYQNPKNNAVSQWYYKGMSSAQNACTNKEDTNQKGYNMPGYINDREVVKKDLITPSKKLKSSDELHTKIQIRNNSIIKTEAETVKLIAVKSESGRNIGHENERPTNNNDSSEVGQNLKNKVILQQCYKDKSSAQNAYSGKVDIDSKLKNVPGSICERTIVKSFLNVAPEKFKCSDELDTKNQINDKNSIKTEAEPLKRTFVQSKLDKRENTVDETEESKDSTNSESQQNPKSNVSQRYYKDTPFAQNTCTDKVKEPKVCILPHPLIHGALVKGFLNEAPAKPNCSDELNKKNEIHDQYIKTKAEPMKPTAVQSKLDRGNTVHEIEPSKDSRASSEIHKNPENIVLRWYKEIPFEPNTCSGTVDTDSKLNNIPVSIDDRAIAKGSLNIESEKCKCNDELDTQNQIYHKENVKPDIHIVVLTSNTTNVTPTTTECKLDTRGNIVHGIKRSKESSASFEIHENSKHYISQRCYKGIPSAQNNHIGEVNREPKMYFISRYINDRATTKEFLNMINEDRKCSNEHNTKAQINNNSIRNEVESVKLTAVERELDTQGNICYENERSSDSSSSSEIQQNLKNTVVSHQFYKDASSAVNTSIHKMDTDPNAYKIHETIPGVHSSLDKKAEAIDKTRSPEKEKMILETKNAVDYSEVLEPMENCNLPIVSEIDMSDGVRRIEIDHSDGEHRIEIDQSNGEHRIETDKSDSERRIEIDKSDGEHRIEIDKSDGEHRIETDKSDGEHRMKIDKSDGEHRIEIDKSDGEISDSDEIEAFDRNRIEIDKSVGEHRIEIDKSDGEHRMEIDKSDGEHRIEIDKSDGEISDSDEIEAFDRNRIEIDKSDGEHRIEIDKSDGEHRMEIDKSDGEHRIEIDKSDGEISDSDEIEAFDRNESYRNNSGEENSTRNLMQPEPLPQANDVSLDVHVETMALKSYLTSVLDSDVVQHEEMTLLLYTAGKFIVSEKENDINTIIKSVCMHKNWMMHIKKYLAEIRNGRVKRVFIKPLQYLLQFLRAFQAIHSTTATKMIKILMPLFKNTISELVKKNDCTSRTNALDSIEREPLFENRDVFETTNPDVCFEREKHSRSRNFRDCPILPTKSDMIERSRFLKPNIVRGQYVDLEHYLDTQFRLLREDFIRPLRDGITRHRCGVYENEKTRTSEIRVYSDVHILSATLTEGGLVHLLNFNNKNMERVVWNRSKRFLFGSLLALSSNNFESIIFATVVRREVEDLQKGLVKVQFEDLSQLRDVDSSLPFAMIETTAYFEAYRHTLAALQTITSETLPFESYILGHKTTSRPPYYLNEKTTYDIRCLNSVAKENYQKKRATNENNGSGNKLWSPFIRLRNPAELYGKPNYKHNVQLLQTEQWPSAEELGLDSFQLKALKAALTKEFTLIQGPPGTGKTYLGLCIVKLLIKRKTLLPILVLSYTNHALDQFLEGVLEFTDDIVRIGAQCSNPKLKTLELRNVKMYQKKYLLPKEYARKLNHASSYLTNLEENIKQCQRNIKRAIRGEINEYDLEGCISRDHLRTLGYCNKGRNEHIFSKWLQGQIAFQKKDEASATRKRRYDRYNRMSISEYNKVNKPEYVEALNDVEDDIDFIENQRALDVDDFVDTNFTKQDSIVDFSPMLNLSDAEIMSRQESETVRDVWILSMEDRFRLYNFWLTQYILQQKQKISECYIAYQKDFKLYQNIRHEGDITILKNCSVVGMTTTGAAKYRSLVQSLNPRIIIVEDAAEILEAHVVTSLAPNTEHLVLIGDHQQLRPNPNVYRLAKRYHLNVSLFERMVENGMECHKLVTQHRMRPEICKLLVPYIYPFLKNAESVFKYENVKGLSKNMFFISHNQNEVVDEDLRSHENLHEAKFLRGLCMYLLRQGYDSSQITILTTYTAQLFTIKRLLKSGMMSAVRVSTVDSFQGEENDIILVSFVRSNFESNINFLKNVNRVCVAISRARMGLYCIGNFELFAERSGIWSDIIDVLHDQDAIGTQLRLICSDHPDNVVYVEAGEDFKKLSPQGGCNAPCDFRLSCGHCCLKTCHTYDSEHEKYMCMKICNKILCENGHICKKRCHESCGECKTLVKKTITSCGHTVDIACCVNTTGYSCHEKCEKRLSCGHRCLNECGEECTTQCEVVTSVKAPCGHEVMEKCFKMTSYNDSLASCNHPCETVLECGHICKGKCSKCLQGRLHIRCKEDCGKILVCGHICRAPCSKSCPPCSETCETRCKHSACKRLCRVPCVECREDCSWSCEHYKCTKLCGEQCNRPTCDHPCKKRLPCRHRCIGLCGEPCPKLCRICNENDVTEIFFGTEEDENARFVQLEDCGHIFEVNGFTRWMETSEEAEIQMKSCPKCKKIMRKNLRFSNAIKVCNEKIQQVKRKLFGDKKKNSEMLESLFNRALENILKKCRFVDEFRMIQKYLRITRDHDNNILLTIENIFNILKEMEEILNSLCSCYTNIWQLILEDQIINICEKEKGFVAYTLKSILKFTRDFRFLASNQQLNSVARELQRIKFIARFTKCVNRADSNIVSKICEDAEKCSDLLFSFEPFKGERVTEVERIVSSLEIAITGLGITKEEKLQILQAMNLKQGHWYQCPNGHVYCITECGGAMIVSKCNECQATIGGINHTLLPDNKVATAMDGARHSAWS